MAVVPETHPARAIPHVEKSLGATFWLGIIVVIALIIPITILMALPIGPAKSSAGFCFSVTLAFSSIGSAGIAAHAGERMKQTGNSYSPFNAFIRGAMIHRTRHFFPLIGWLFVWIPILILPSAQPRCVAQLDAA
ncbi:MAG: hypothetical protein U0X93_10940 [Anaerolineales bacterium]